jgi:hypothetical protein
LFVIVPPIFFWKEWKTLSILPRRQNTSIRRNTLKTKTAIMNKLQSNSIRRFPHLTTRGALAGLSVLLLTALSQAVAGKGQNNPAQDLPAALEVPPGNNVAFHAFAVGVQIYEWSGSAWVFVAPEAVLFADAGTHGEVGVHYAGPSWESQSGSKVVGARVAGATVDPTAIPWLLLRAVSSEGSGIFHGVTFIQRVNTTGGTAPATPGTASGTRVEVPYTAEYVFYR